ncbi:amidase [Clostridiisalibacter paucivorans]|uniref:amidase n=1 Tax=Clostridiisalibacter paucivorans TaxID=408753 RepID=UPI00068702F4|nr:amidase [Clostridiisalibacter paucivorans]
MKEILDLPIKEIYNAIIEKKISSYQLVKIILDRIQSFNPSLNGLVQINEDILKEAKKADERLNKGEYLGKLHGIPVTIKDSFDTSGIVSTAGTLGRKDYIPDKDAEVVRRLKEQGALILGKTNTPELTLIFETDNIVYGRTNNPYDLERTSGGSSGGEAAMIASGCSILGIGSDTGGSIRLPAHNCGIAGLKPTYGRISRAGHIVSFGGVLDFMTQIGPMAKYIEDLEYLLPILSGYDANDPSTVVNMPIYDSRDVDLSTLRIAYFIDNGILTPSKDTIDVIKEGAMVLKNIVSSVDQDLPSYIEYTDRVYGKIFASDGGKWVRKILDKYNTKEIHQSLKWAFTQNKGISAEELSELLYMKDKIRANMAIFMDSYDVILCPVNAYPAMKHGEASNKENRRAYSYTKTFNLTGNPVVTVRCGTSSDGLPIAIQVVARHFREDIAFAVAKKLEDIFGGWVKPFYY